MAAALRTMKQKWPLALDDDFLETVDVAQLLYNDPGMGVFVTNNDEVHVIGTDAKNHFGRGPVIPIPQLTQVRELCGQQVEKFTAGVDYVLILTKMGAVFAWGSNVEGQLGNNSLIPAKVPVVVGGDLGGRFVRDIACGNTHSLALTERGEVYTWGSNWRGKTGHGTDADFTMVPKQIAALAEENIVSLAANENASIFLNDKGEVFTCGHNYYGYLGIGNTSDKALPVKVKALSSHFVESISSGSGHTLALTNTGLLFTWGENCNGQIGNGTRTTATLPVQINFTEDKSFDARVLALEASGHSSSAVDTDDKVHVWGLVEGNSILRPAATALKSRDSFTNKVSKVNRHDKVVATLEAAFNEKETSDFIIEVENREIFVHKAILRIRSQHFKNMFKGVSQSVCDGKKVVKNQSYEVYHAYLKYVYTGKLEPVQCETASKLLSLAHSIPDETLIALCDNHVRKTLTFDNVARVFGLALSLDLKELVDFSVRYAMRGMASVVKSEAFTEMTGEDVKAFFKKGSGKGLFARD